MQNCLGLWQLLCKILDKRNLSNHDRRLLIATKEIMITLSKDYLLRNTDQYYSRPVRFISFFLFLRWNLHRRKFLTIFSNHLFFRTCGQIFSNSYIEHQHTHDIQIRRREKKSENTPKTTSKKFLPSNEQ